MRGSGVGKFKDLSIPSDGPDVVAFDPLCQCRQCRVYRASGVAAVHDPRCPYGQGVIGRVIHPDDCFHCEALGE